MWTVQAILTESGSRNYDISNDVMKSAILKLSSDDISERVVRSTSCLIPGVFCQQRANHIVFQLVQHSINIVKAVAARWAAKLDLLA